MSDEQPESFAPTSGRVVGIIGIAIATFVLVVAIADREAGLPLWLIGGAVLAIVLIWAATLRPRVSLVGDHLVLRNMLETIEVPLAAIEEMAVRQVLAVRVGDKRFVSPALGKSRRDLAARPPMMSGVRRKPTVDKGTVDYADFVEERIRRRMEDTRAAQGIRPASAEQLALAADVRRTPAKVEIVMLATSTIVVVVGFLV